MADLDGDGQAEIIEGDAQWGSVNIYDTATYAVRTSIAYPGNSISAVAAVDLLGDRRPLVAFSAASAPVPLYLADPANGQIVSQLPASSPGTHSAVALDDVNGDGALEFAYGAGAGWQTAAGGQVTIVNASDGMVEWRSPASTNVNDPFAFTPAALAYLDDTLIVAGNRYNTVRLVALDMHDYSVVWRVGPYSSGPMENRHALDLALADLDADGVDDVIVGTRAANYSAQGAKLFVFSGVDGSPLWQSVSMGTNHASLRGVMAGDTGAPGGPEIVAVLTDSLRAYDVQTRLLNWVLPMDVDGASLLANGASGIEFGVFLGDALSFLDGATHALLRSFTVDGNVAALRQLGDIRHLVVAVDGHLEIIDGLDGTVLARSTFLGEQLGANNQLAVHQVGPQTWLIGVGSGAGAFRYRVDVSEHIFASGFESLTSP